MYEQRQVRHPQGGLLARVQSQDYHHEARFLKIKHYITIFSHNKQHFSFKAIVMAVDAVRDRMRSELELEHKKYNWKEGEEGFVPTEGEDWITLVTLPTLGSQEFYNISNSVNRP